MGDDLPTHSDYTTPAGRKRCYAARDAYFKCLRRNREDKSKCVQEEKVLKESGVCLNVWVRNFIKSRNEKIGFSLLNRGAITLEDFTALMDDQVDLSAFTPPVASDDDNNARR